MELCGIEDGSYLVYDDDQVDSYSNKGFTSKLVTMLTAFIFFDFQQVLGIFLPFFLCVKHVKCYLSLSINRNNRFLCVWKKNPAQSQIAKMPYYRMLLFISWRWDSGYKMILQISMRVQSTKWINPSSPKGGCTNPPNGFRPGAQNRTVKG